MNSKISFPLMLISFFITSCGGLGKITRQQPPKNPNPPNDQAVLSNTASYGYTPIDPIPANIDTSLTKPQGYPSFLNLFSDETMRLAIGSSDGSANISYGKSAIGFKGQRYSVVLDYIKYVTVPYQVWVWRDHSRKHVYISSLDPDKEPNNNPVAGSIFGVDSSIYDGQNVVPLYVGLGLRITADVTVMSDTLNLNLFGLGAAAGLGKASGSLVVQTLGVSGANISALLPMPSELNQTTIQNAIVALGSIKSKMYESETVLAPRVLGFSNYIGGSGLEVPAYVISNILNRPVVVKQLFLNNAPSSNKAKADSSGNTTPAGGDKITTATGDKTTPATGDKTTPATGDKKTPTSPGKAKSPAEAKTKSTKGDKTAEK